MLVALMALFVALGGVGYAAATIGSAQIKNNSVKSTDLKNNDVRSKDIRTGNVTGSDIKNNSARGTDILESSLGKVPSAATADNAGTVNNGAITATKLGNIVTRQLAITVPATTAFGSNANCAPDEKLIGGGTRITGAGVPEVTLQSSGPSNQPPAADVPADGEGFNAWRGAGYNGTGSPRNVVISAICLRP